MNYRPIWTISDIEVGRNSQVFRTKKEALESAKARFLANISIDMSGIFSAWPVPIGFSVEPTDERVTYERIEGIDYAMQTIGTNPDEAEEISRLMQRYHYLQSIDEETIDEESTYE